MRAEYPISGSVGLLAHEAYKGFAHAASLKGLLKPFKGKGALEELAQMTRDMELRLAGLMEDMVRRAGLSPLRLLDARLVKQTACSGAVYLRWRLQGRARMGVRVWEEQMAVASLSPAMRQALHEFEQARITLNMQMSVVHALHRQALECAQKMASAERVLRQYSGNDREN